METIDLRNERQGSAQVDWKRWLARPVAENPGLERTVASILEQVRIRGDDALREYALKFDKAQIQDLEIPREQMKEAEAQVSAKLKESIEMSMANLSGFHRQQAGEPEILETQPGVRCWRRNLPIEKVGLYIPGGTAPLFSTLLMLGVPAKLAGCREIIVCSPPDTRGQLHPAIRYTALRVGATRLFAVGGAQAIAAMAFGTASIPRVFKIFGPGNPYVQCAKQLVQREGLSIDLPAGPSEVAIYADASAHPAFVAADLLAQAEHGVDSQVMLVCLSPSMAEAIQKEIAVQVDRLPRGQIALRALQNSRTMLVENEEKALAIINAYAPEHLILASDHADRLSLLVLNAGSVFLGHYSPESAGDYATGTNHVLPTAGFARSFSGVSVDSFVKKVSFQHLTRAGLARIGPAVETMAEAEGLKGHARAVSIRLSTVQSTPDS